MTSFQLSCWTGRWRKYFAAAANTACRSARIHRVVARTLGIAGADFISRGVRILLIVWPIGYGDAIKLVATISLDCLLLSALLALALETREGTGPITLISRQRPLLTAVVIGAIVFASVVGDVTTFAVRLGVAASSESLRLYLVWNNAIVALVAVAYLTRREQAVNFERSQRVQEARLFEARRRLAMVVAQTSRSRLDPQMLFDCMSRARDVYGSDNGRGDALLDRLTHYLRVTLGGAADGACTLGREAEIAAARIDVERCDDDPPLALTIPTHLEQRPFPPELLASLAHDWLAAAGGARKRLDIRAVVVDGRLRVTVDGPCLAPAAAVSACEHAVATFTSGNGSVRQAASSLQLELGRE